MDKYETNEVAAELSEEVDVSYRPLAGKWWKYGLALALLQVGGWLLLGYKLNISALAGFDLLGFFFGTGYTVYGTFVVLSFLPFVFGRFRLTALMWFSLVGLLLGIASYYLLAAFEPTRQFNLLPFVSYLQLAFAGISIGIVWEFGKYVFRKLREE